MLRTPFFQPKVETFIKNLTVQTQDSVIKAADYLIGKATNKEIKEYLIYYITNQYEMPNTVGTEGVFVHMAENYYLNGIMPVSEDGKKRIKDRVAVLKPLLVNKIFPSLTLSDPQNKPINLQQIQADYTVVFFYSPTCGHCKEAAPKLVEAFNTHKDKNVKILAVAIDQKGDWGKYIQEQKTSMLLNGYDNTQQIDFRNKFDVLSTPMVYVLDKGKRIIARRMPVEQLSDFLNFTINKNKKP
jgi:thiol-disulfide isomerase/thioredoxin